MQQSKLLDILRRLNARQLSRFGDFLLSPYFNKNQDNVLFFNYLQKYAPAFNHANLQKELVLKKLKIPKIVEEKSLSYLMSQLTKLLEEFLAIEHFRSAWLDAPLSQLAQYHTLQLPKYYQSTLYSLEKTLEKMPYRNADYYRNELIFRRLQYEQSDPNQRGFNQKLQEAADALDLYFLIEKLRYACEMQNLSNMLNLSYRQSFTTQTAEWAGEAAFADIPALQVYHQLFLLLSTSDTAHFEEARHLLMVHGNLFTPEECKQLYTLLLNFCTRRINHFNDEKYWHEYMEINKLLLQNGLLLEHGQLPPWRYANLVAVGLRTGQTAWTYSFIHEFKDKLPEAYTDNLFRYNLAQYHFHQKNYGEAQRQLIYVEFTDVMLNISARSLLIRIYYETAQTEPLLSYLEATRIFLLRNKLLDPRLKQLMKKFLEICAKMAKAEGHPERLAELRETLPPAAEVMHWDWLVEKMRGSGRSE
jgi:hypothetical protein